MDGAVGKSWGTRLADFFFPVYERYFEERNEDLKKTVEVKLAESMRNESVEMFLSRSIGYGVILGLILWALLTFIVWAVFVLIGVDVGVLIGIPVKSDAVLAFIKAVKIPALITVTGIVGGIFGFSFGFASPILNLYLQSSGRKREINILLPDAVSFMHALSMGGMNQIQVFEAVARAEGVYGEISHEFAIILQETRYFGVDYRSAIRERSLNTPSSAFSQFLTDMLSILNSGGSLTSFLDEKRQKYMRTAKQQQEQDLETMELFGEMYMTLSLFPLLLIILLVIMSLIGSSNDVFLFGIVYLLIPMTGFGFLVMISTVKTDDPGDGKLSLEGDALGSLDEEEALGRGVIDSFSSPYNVMDTIGESEGTRKAVDILFKPHKFLASHPEFTLLITVPIVLVLLTYSAITGIVPVSWGGMKEYPIWSTFMFFYMPMYVLGLPYTVAYEVKARKRRSITSDLSDNLRKLSSANDTGQTLLESFKSVSETSTGLLSREFEIIYNKVQYGTSMKQALIEFNNKYQRPRLARMIKLIAKAQETSSQITDVLTTAADASEQADDMNREQKSRSRMQVVIIIMTYLTLLVVMVILKTQFLDVMAKLTMGGGGGGGGGGGAGFNGVNVPKLSLLFLHAVTMQGIAASMISGYLRTSTIQSGVKFMQILPTIALIAWMFV